MPRGAAALFSTIVALLLMAGCTPDADDEPTGASRTDETTVSTTPEPDPAFSEGTRPRTGGAAKASDLVLVDVRVAAAEHYDRIVLEFSGTGTPGWVVNYVDEAVLDGSGEVVELDGRASLDIYASDTTWPAPDYYDGPTQITANGDAVTAVHVGGTFEGTTQVIAGIDGAPAPFRVLTLTAPSRLVIDVMHTSNDNG
ncbi:AMIN-like domain-containing (lipo)protein [Nocardioides alcanivorans]|uniref:AMIN-like domain-containing (lipo)protein n=1 Tax=Nocardioides alcanivorans TaxID=2897352 RepID=UPI001F234F8B|nr:hypothetical protein [Nocardioides alcanivorans]